MLFSGLDLASDPARSWDTVSCIDRSGEPCIDSEVDHRVDRSAPTQRSTTSCADPMNFSRWASARRRPMEPLGGDEWLVDLPRGRMVIRCHPPNNFGVLDYAVYERGESAATVRPVRLVRQRGGTDLGA